MRKRELLKQVWISYDEDRNLKIKCQKASMTESAVIRCLINSYEPREKPDDRFYEALKDQGLVMTAKAARLLYIGIVGDTGRFMYSMDKETFRVVT